MENDMNSEEEKRKLENFLKKVNKQQPKIRKKHVEKSLKQRQQFSKAIHNRLSEYCDGYILFAYDNTGSPYIIINQESELEKRGLTDLLMEYVQETMTQQISISPDSPDEEQE